MAKYVSFLRGINVGGRIIKMADLKACFEAMGFKNVSTLLQTGNVIFESDKAATDLKSQIEKALTKSFNYPARIWLIPLDDLQKIIAANPFADAGSDYHQYVIFFEGNLAKDFAAEVLESVGEEVKAGRNVVYWKVQKGMTLKSQRGKLLAKPKYRDFNTNRNINTLQKMLKLGQV